MSHQSNEWVMHDAAWGLLFGLIVTFVFSFVYLFIIRPRNYTGVSSLGRHLTHEPAGRATLASLFFATVAVISAIYMGDGHEYLSFSGRVGTPIFSPPTNSFVATGTQVVITSEQSTHVCWRSDGVAPSCDGTGCSQDSKNQSTEAIPPISTTSVLLKAIGCGSGNMTPSKVAIAQYGLLNAANAVAQTVEEEECGDTADTCDPEGVPVTVLVFELDWLRLPCTESTAGNFFLFIVLGYTLYRACGLLASGLDALETHCGNAAFIGSVISPSIGALPDAILVMVTTKCQQEVAGGMGMLVASNALLLTVPWLIAVLHGRRNLSGEQHTARYFPRTIPNTNEIVEEDRLHPLYSWKWFQHCGVTVYAEVTDQAQLMLCSLFPFLVIQLIVFTGTKEQTRASFLIFFFICMLFFFILVLLQYSDIHGKSAEYKRYQEDAKGFKRNLVWLQTAAFYGKASSQEVDRVLNLVHATTTNQDAMDEVVSEKRHLRQSINCIPDDMTEEQLENFKKALLEDDDVTAAEILSKIDDEKKAKVENSKQNSSLDSPIINPTLRSNDANISNISNASTVGSVTVTSSTPKKKSALITLVRQVSHGAFDAGLPHDSPEFSTKRRRRASKARSTLDRAIELHRIERNRSLRKISRRQEIKSVSPVRGDGRKLHGRRRAQSTTAESASVRHIGTSIFSRSHTHSMKHIPTHSILEMTEDQRRKDLSLRHLQLHLKKMNATAIEKEARGLTKYDKQQLRQKAWALMNEAPVSQMRTIFDCWLFFAERHVFQTKRADKLLAKINLAQDKELGNSNVLEGWLNCLLCKCKAPIVFAVTNILIALALVLVFGDPFVSVLFKLATKLFGDSSASTSLAAMVVPVLTSQEVVASYQWTQNKQKGKISMCYSSLYGGVAMNNCLVFGAFLISMYANDLYWDFAPESIAILVTGSFVGLIGSFFITYPIWMGFLVICCFPLSFCIIVLFKGPLAGATPEVWGIIAMPVFAIIIYILARETWRIREKILIRFQLTKEVRGKKERRNRISHGEIEDGGDIEMQVTKKDPEKSASKKSKKQKSKKKRIRRSTGWGRGMMNQDHHWDISSITAANGGDSLPDLRKQLRSAFNHFNNVGDDKHLTFEDLQVAFEDLGFDVTDDDIRSMIKDIDKDNSGGIDMIEFENLFISGHNDEKVRDSILDGAFKSFANARLDETDKKRESSIDIDDLRVVAHEILGYTYIEEFQLNQMIDDADGDNDGEIKIEEFKSILETMGLIDDEQNEDNSDYKENTQSCCVCHYPLSSNLGEGRGRANAGAESEEGLSDDEYDEYDSSMEGEEEKKS
eukprot:g6017.t1